ncbi:High affinity cAMP-specific and IBMX-insensitive 3',5'-cyclic phosphodiesterase 9A [Balamuthia mandrillaris]
MNNHKLDINDSVLDKGGVCCRFGQCYAFQPPTAQELSRLRHAIFETDNENNNEGLIPSDLHLPTFDLWDYDSEQLCRLVVVFFEQLDLVRTFSIPLETLQNFVVCLRCSYRENPFHNFRHAFTVAHMLFLFFTLGEEEEEEPGGGGEAEGGGTTRGEKEKKDDKDNEGLRPREVFTKLETLALLVAALCHDLDHPGLSNQYHINAVTSLALLYNNCSPLENHHCSCAWRLLYNPSTNILINLSLQQRLEIRPLIITLILNTDMSKHFDIMRHMQDKLKASTSSSSSSTAAKWQDRESKLLLMSIMMKAADISNEARPWSVSKRWADLLIEEFFNQGDRERSEGRSISAMMDRETVSQATAQLGFIDNILSPTLSALTQVFPRIRCLLPSLEENRARWKAASS